MLIVHLLHTLNTVFTFIYLSPVLILPKYCWEFGWELHWPCCELFHNGSSPRIIPRKDNKAEEASSVLMLDSKTMDVLSAKIMGTTKPVFIYLQCSAELRDVTAERKHWRRMVKTVARIWRVDSTRWQGVQQMLKATILYLKKDWTIQSRRRV